MLRHLQATAERFEQDMLVKAPAFLFRAAVCCSRRGLLGDTPGVHLAVLDVHRLVQLERPRDGDGSNKG